MATQDMGHHPLPALPPAQQQQHHHHPLPSPPQQQQHHQQQQQYQQQPQQQYAQQQYAQQQQQFHSRPPLQQQHSQQSQQSQQHAHFSQNPQQHPGHSQKPQTKPRSFSFRSDRSQGSNVRTDSHETSAEKEAKRLHSKADPTLAMNEAEPSLVQATVKSSLAPLRAIQHKDTFGNDISEPDRSNPTRSRWERPLDTIRSFEAAIDGGYSRKSFIRSDSDSVANFNNRRSSYYGNNGPRFPQDSYYGGRPASAAFRPDSASQFEVRAPGRESYVDPQNNGNGYGYGMAGPSRQRASRMQSQPELNTYSRGGPSVYPLPHKDRSYETVNSAAGSGSSAEAAGYQTDPTSSDNSSIDRHSPMKMNQPKNDYGIGFSASPTYQPQAFTVGPNPGYHGGPVGGTPMNFKGKKPVPSQNMGGQLPPVPQKDYSVMQRRPLPQQQLQQQQQRPDMGEKRKSWFSRRFSRAS